MKKAAILSLDAELDELKSLLDTLGIEVVKEFIQKTRYPHKTSFLGPGKIDEVYDQMKDLGLDIIVINGILRPSQHHFLEMKFQTECIDRPGVILRIFASHAHSPEAIAQVTLARLRYEQPFLREWIHKAKRGDRPGFLAGGAYATDVYYEHAKTHSRKIEKSLRELMERRKTIRLKRREKGYLLVSLAGHTNVGKSALLNALSGSQVEVDDRMFSTLSTTTRSLPGPVNQILLTDTVGFIRNLPPDLIDAFNSTLEEIFQADLVLLVFDVSEKEDIIREKLLSSLDILTPEVNTRALLLVGNKVDLLSGARRNDVEALIDREFRGRTLFLVSAKTGEGLDELINRIAGLQDYSYAIDITVPQTNEVYSLLSRLRSIAKIELVSSESILRIRILCRSEDRQKIEGWIRAVDGQIISAHDNSPSALSERNTPPQEDKGALSFARPP